MASEIQLKITWENNDFFQMTHKKDAGAVTQVVRMEENGQIKELWGYMASACKEFFSTTIDNIGKEMKA